MSTAHAFWSPSMKACPKPGHNRAKAAKSPADNRKLAAPVTEALHHPCAQLRWRHVLVCSSWRHSLRFLGLIQGVDL